MFIKENYFNFLQEGDYLCSNLLHRYGVFIRHVVNNSKYRVCVAGNVTNLFLNIIPQDKQG